jgi:hypothetical protein
MRNYRGHTCIALVGAFTVVTLSACATPYQKRGFSGGYTDEYLGNDRWWVAFSANGFTGAHSVAAKWRRRAAEVCKKTGFSWWREVSGKWDTDTSYLQPTYTTTQIGETSYTYAIGGGTIHKHSRYGVVQCLSYPPGQEPCAKWLACFTSCKQDTTCEVMCNQAAVTAACQKCLKPFQTCTSICESAGMPRAYCTNEPKCRAAFDNCMPR